MKSMCPLCNAVAETEPPIGDRRRYDCQTCGSFEITGSEEAGVKANPKAARRHQERIARERERGILISRVG
jgi:hypothetical protein